MPETKTMDKFTMIMDKMAVPMTKFGNLKAIRAIQNGLVASVPITIVGSLFCLLNLFATPDKFSEGITILPFLTTLANEFNFVNQLTMSMLAVYVVISIAINFGSQYDIDPVTSALSSLMSFLLLTNSGNISAAIASMITDTNMIVDGTFTGSVFNALNVSNWGGGGLIVAILAALGSVFIIHLCYDHNIKITLPDGVPPAISESFSALIPYVIIATISWSIMSVLSLDLAEMIKNSLLPILSAADNAFTYSLVEFIRACFWSIGLHGDNITNAVTSTFTNIWLNENALAATAGTAIPHIWIPNLTRLDQWVSSVWPILFMLLTSKKLKHMKPFAIACTPAAIFGIVEPVVYGLPIVLNPYFFIPMIISHTLTAFVTYFSVQFDFVARAFVSAPWCMPAPILAWLQSGGDFMAALVVVINFFIGLAILYPFFKVYEKQEVAKLQANLTDENIN